MSQLLLGDKVWRNQIYHPLICLFRMIYPKERHRSNRLIHGKRCCPLPITTLTREKRCKRSISFKAPPSSDNTTPKRVMTSLTSDEHADASSSHAPHNRAKIHSPAIMILVIFPESRIITYGGGRNKQLKFHASRVYGMHQLSGHANTAIIQLLFVSLRPTFINGSARQINDDFTGFHASA